LKRRFDTEMADDCHNGSFYGLFVFPSYAQILLYFGKITGNCLDGILFAL
jgi:hypothetical protein